MRRFDVMAPVRHEAGLSARRSDKQGGNAHTTSRHILALWPAVVVTTLLASAPTETRYTCTPSRGGVSTFLPATTVASVASNEEQPLSFRNAIGRQYGDYTAVVAADGVAHVFWTESRDLHSLGEEIFTATLRVNSKASTAG